MNNNDQHDCPNSQATPVEECVECKEEQAQEDAEDTVNTVGRIQVGFDVVEVQKVDLKPGDVLMVTIKNDDLDHACMSALRNQLKMVFPDNKIFVFGMGAEDDVKFTIVSQESVAKFENVGYCSDCDCGKKERATLQGESDGRSQSESTGNDKGTCGTPSCCSER